MPAAPQTLAGQVRPARQRDQGRQVGDREGGSGAPGGSSRAVTLIQRGAKLFDSGPWRGHRPPRSRLQREQKGEGR